MTIEKIGYISSNKFDMPKIDELIEITQHKEDEAGSQETWVLVSELNLALLTNAGFLSHGEVDEINWESVDIIIFYT